MSQQPRTGPRTVGTGKLKGDKQGVHLYLDSDVAARFRRFMGEHSLNSCQALAALLDKAGVQ